MAAVELKEPAFHYIMRLFLAVRPDSLFLRTYHIDHYGYQAFLENSNRYAQTAAQSAVFSMLFSFGKLISDDYNRSLHGQELRTEHKLKAAIRRKKQALGMKENPLENPQFKR